jgi:hypothetical protein
MSIVATEEPSPFGMIQKNRSQALDGWTNMQFCGYFGGAQNSRYRQIRA